PGYDGSSDFLSFASTLDPVGALTAYVNQLIDAGYRDAGRQGTWRVFVDPTMTVWVRVGSAGPPTSLVVRFARTEDAGLAGPAARPGPAASGPADAAGTGPSSIGTSPGSGQGTTTGRRPDPPHAGQAGTGSSSVSGGGTAAGGSTSNPGSAGPTGGPAAGSESIHDSSGGGTGSRP
ncbi:MAG: hypothetical protein M3P84_12785, partial [Chloroflexota bacterium]|nr:hypothetical protein [Chloroflexota bacterium]